MKKIFRLGSCRIFDLNDNNCNFHFINQKPIGYSYSLKEHIQLIKFLRSEIAIDDDLLKYMFTLYDSRKASYIEKIYQDNVLAIKEADMFLIEVSSLKIFQFLDYFFRVSRVKQLKKLNNFRLSKYILDEIVFHQQSESEFEQDFQFLIGQLGNKPCIFTGHLNFISKQTGTKIDDRILLDQYLCKNTQKHGFYYYDLSKEILQDQDKYIEEDLLHLKAPAFLIAEKLICNFVKMHSEKSKLVSR